MDDARRVAEREGERRGEREQGQTTMDKERGADGDARRGAALGSTLEREGDLD